LSQAFFCSRSARPDVVLLDLALPQDDGFEVADYLRNTTELKRDQFIVITGRAETAIQERCQQEGLKHFLAKPVTLEVLCLLLLTWPRPLRASFNPGSSLNPQEPKRSPSSLSNQKVQIHRHPQEFVDRAAIPEPSSK
jgi:CheY-like chemotaxis protein